MPGPERRLHLWLTAIAALLLSGSVAAEVDKLVVIGLFKNQVILIIDGQQRRLKTGDSSPEGVKLIAADSESATLEVNGRQDIYRLGMHISSRYSEPRSGPVVRLWPEQDSGLYLADGSINGFAMNFVVDTGASFISMNSHQASRLGINYRMEGQEGLAQTASGVSKIYIINLNRVRIGGIEVRDVRAAVHEGQYPTRVLLGNSFLQKIDLKREGSVLELQGKP